jgi:hypothetical protein
MNCNVHVFYKMIFSNKFGSILETSLFLQYIWIKNFTTRCRSKSYLWYYNTCLFFSEQVVPSYVWLCPSSIVVEQLTRNPQWEGSNPASGT